VVVVAEMERALVAQEERTAAVVAAGQRPEELVA
jgi:hypothetical protein